MDNGIIGAMNMGFIISLSFAILFFIITVILAFVFDIKTIFFMRTGRAQAKTVNEMKKANADTGRLRVDGKTQTGKLSEKSKKKGRVPAVIPPPHPEQAAPAPEGSMETDVLSQNQSQETADNQTTVLGSDETQTTVLGSDETQTTVLNAEPAHTQETKAHDDNSQSEASESIHFVVTKEVILTHTDEVI